MQASASATAAAMTECMQLTRPGVQEHQLAAVFGECPTHAEQLAAAAVPQLQAPPLCHFFFAVAPFALCHVHLDAHADTAFTASMAGT